MQVSFIIINYNTPALSLQCVDSIIQQVKALSYEIIVIDNASEDQSVTLLKAKQEIKLYINTTNEGFGRANNLAASKAIGKYLFFINSDAYLLNDAASIFYHFMEDPKHTHVAVCGGDLLTATGEKQVSYGNFPSVWQVIAEMGFRHLCSSYYAKHLALSVKNHGSKPLEVDYLSGACWFIRRELFLQIGGFDPDFFLYFEETELAYRLKKKGYSAILLPQARLVHLEGVSTSGQDIFNEKRFTLFEHSRMLFYRKCYGKVQAYLVKLLLLLHTWSLALIRKDVIYLKKSKIIWKA